MSVEVIMPHYILVIFSAVFGLAIGSFLNVVIYRIPEGLSLMGRSFCPKCQHRIREYDNVPVLGWLLLKGKCRDCQAPISPRYPLVEAFTGVAWAVLAYFVGYSWMLIPLLILLSCSIALAMIDFDTLRLPNSIVLFTTVTVAAGVIFASSMEGSYDNLIRASLGAVVSGLFYFVFWFFSGGRALGFGDVKLAPILGFVTAYYSWGTLVTATAAAWVLGAIVGVAGMALGKFTRGKQIPFGPYLLAGVWVGLAFGEMVSNWYMSLMYL